MSKVLFVCMGNICRSPMAEGAFQRAVDEYINANADSELSIEFDSAATTSYHIGDPPDPRACDVSTYKGVDIRHQRARQVNVADFDQFDYVVAMDKSNLRDLLALAPKNSKAEVALFLSYSQNAKAVEVPDPYFGGDEGFMHCFDLIDGAAKGLLEHIIKQHHK
ncbi:MAG: low molecular weight phosphotyrosine protein phosphatase [Sphingomonadales bacterium]|nr:low molecular weight phosphotyrosine protein phosphatase [Sphingomonadales bacterium]